MGYLERMRRASLYSRSRAATPPEAVPAAPVPEKKKQGALIGGWLRRHRASIHGVV